jgi:site-specific recombinase XerD
MPAIYHRKWKKEIPQSALGACGHASRHPAKVEAFFEMLAVERGAVRTTLEGYRRDLAHYAAFLAERDLQLEAADADSIRGYLARLTFGLSTGSKEAATQSTEATLA